MTKINFKDIEKYKKKLHIKDIDFSDLEYEEMGPAPDWMLPYLQELDLEAFEGRSVAVNDMKRRWQESDYYKQLYGDDIPHTKEDNDL